MIKIRNNKKGMTLIEIIMAITILAVVALPLFASFTSTFALINKKQKVIDENALARIVKENAVDCVKNGIGGKVYSLIDLDIDGDVDENDYVYFEKDTFTWNNLDVNNKTASDLKISNSINDDYNQFSSDYKFSITYIDTYQHSSNGYTDGISPDPFENVKKFEILIENVDGRIIRNYYIYVDIT